jgi:hypothetical protein
MAEATADDSSATEEEDEPLSLEDQINSWVRAAYLADDHKMVNSIVQHQATCRFRCQRAGGNECCDPNSGCKLARCIDPIAMAKYEAQLAQFEEAQAGLGGTKKRKGMSPKEPVPQNHVFSEMFGRDLAKKIPSFHVRTSQSLRDVLYRSLKKADSDGVSTDAILPKSQQQVKRGNDVFELSDGVRISLKFPAQSMVDGQTQQYENKFWVGQQPDYEFRFERDKKSHRRLAIDGVNPNVSPRRSIGSNTNPLHMRSDDHNQQLFICACMRETAQTDYDNIEGVSLRWVLPARVVQVKNPDVSSQDKWLASADLMVPATAHKLDIFAPLEIDLSVFRLEATCSKELHEEIKAQWLICLADTNNDNWGQPSQCAKWFRAKLCQICPRFLALVDAKQDTRMARRHDALQCGRPVDDTYVQRYDGPDEDVLGTRQFDRHAARRMHDLFVVLQGHRVLERLPQGILQAILDNLAMWLGGKIRSETHAGDCGTLSAACYEYVTAPRLNKEVFKCITSQMKSSVETEGVVVAKKKASTLVQNAQPIDVEDGRNICFQGATQDELIAEFLARGITVDALPSAPSSPAKQPQTASHRAR